MGGAKTTCAISLAFAAQARSSRNVVGVPIYDPRPPNPPDRACSRGAGCAVEGVVVMRLGPITVSAARNQVRAWHRHLPEVQGGLFAVQCLTDAGECVGVAIAGNPARVWQGSGRIVISRVATDGHENACSMLYGALCRAAKALGYVEAWTYTLPDEPGVSLRAAGFIDMGMTSGGEHSRPSRYRNPAKHPEPKRRWMRKLQEAQP